MTLDVHEPIPVGLRGKYDVVHVRLFLTVVKNDDPGPILENMLRMLSQSCCRSSSTLLMLLPARTGWISPMV